MPKLYSSKYIIRVLEKHGFYFVSQKGSHIKMRSTTQPIRTVIVPANKKDIPYGTFRSIVRQSSLIESAFEDKQLLLHLYRPCGTIPPLRIALFYIWSFRFIYWLPSVLSQRARAMHH